MKPRAGRFAAVVVGFLWISTSAVFSTFANGLFLRIFNDAYAHTFLRFALSSLIGFAYFSVAGKSLLQALPRLSVRLFLPAVLLTIANLLNSMSMKRSGVTVAYIVKSLIPLFTIFFCRLRGQHFGAAAYASLVPVCLGVSLASATDLQVTVPGLLCALGSSLAQTLLNIASKERIQELQLSGMEAFFVMATVSATLSAPLMLFSYMQPDGMLRTLAAGGCVGERALESFWAPWQVVVLAAVAYHLEYTLNFLFVALCSPLTFSLTDIMRRLGTICVGAVLFAKALTLLNAVGIATAMLGVLSYTLVSKKHQEAVEHHVKEDEEEPWVSHYGLLADKGRQESCRSRSSRQSSEDTWVSHYGLLAERGRQESCQSRGSQHSSEETAPSDPRLEVLLSPILSPILSPVLMAKAEEWYTLSGDSSLGISPKSLCNRGVLVELNDDLETASNTSVATSEANFP